METAFSLGSNLDDRLNYLREARDRLAAAPGARLVAQSAVYETEPVGVKPEHRNKLYLNAVVIIDAPLNAAAWLGQTRRIELDLGRVRGTDRFAPRTMDIDILYSGAGIMHTPDLQVPHPRARLRRFVLQPLADLRPDLILPGQTQTVAELLAALPAGENVWPFARDW